MNSILKRRSNFYLYSILDCQKAKFTGLEDVRIYYTSQNTHQIYSENTENRYEWVLEDYAGKTTQFHQYVLNTA